MMRGMFGIDFLNYFTLSGFYPPPIIIRIAGLHPALVITLLWSFIPVSWRL